MNPVAPLSEADYQARQDADHLHLLSIFYYVLGGLLMVMGLLFIFHIIMGLAIVNGAFGPPSGTITLTPNTFPSAPTPSSSIVTTAPNAAPPAAFGWIFVGMGTLALTLSEILGGLTIYAGRCLANRTNKIFVQVIAALLCLHVPLGTVLGVFTFIVLNRPTVAALFERRPTL